jgi:hypothetical protein
MEELSKEVITLKEKVHNLELCYVSINNDVKEIKEKLLGRPTYNVLIIISFLSSACVGLSVAFLSTLYKL